MLRHECRDNSCLENIPTVEHDYILHQECILSNDCEQQSEQQEQQEQEESQQQQQHQLTVEGSFQREDCAEYVNLLVKAADATTNQEEGEDEIGKSDVTNTDIKKEQESQCQNETRRSKRKSVRRNFETNRDSDEENYFENLNLSSRLRKAQASDKSEKIFFLCYLCDKEFLSKNVLKEHMYSHEEVRKTLSLKKTLETSQKNTCNLAKSPPSGKRSNKCPYCGKQYIYIISFSKHLKKHER
ncbi:hypothetical protein ANTQUA_LOCUS3417, partial [Anthophora quadrimaculata]